MLPEKFPLRGRAEPFGCATMRFQFRHVLSFGALLQGLIRGRSVVILSGLPARRRTPDGPRVSERQAAMFSDGPRAPYFLGAKTAVRENPSMWGRNSTTPLSP